MRESDRIRARQSERTAKGSGLVIVVGHTLQTLPAKYREVLTLFYFHDLDVKATAQSLGLREGTVKARLSRGRVLLHRKLATVLDP